MVSCPLGLGGTSSTLSQNSDSRSAGRLGEVAMMRRLWSLCASMRNSGGVIRNGVSALSGVDWGLPWSIQASTSAGVPPTFDSRTVTSPSRAGKTTRVPPMTTVAWAPKANRHDASRPAHEARRNFFIAEIRSAGGAGAASPEVMPWRKPVRHGRALRLLVDHREGDAGVHVASTRLARRVVLGRVVQGGAAGAVEVDRQRA